MLFDPWWQQNVREMFHSPPHNFFDFYCCISICCPTHSPSMGDIFCFFQILSLVFLMTFPANSLHGPRPTSYVCIPALPNSSCPQQCFFLTYSIIPHERLFLKFLSHIFKRMIVKFSVKKSMHEKWVGLVINE